MPDLSLPTEIILLIAQNLDDERDLNALARTNRRNYDLLDPVLYRHDVLYTHSSALRWAVLERVERTVRKSLDHGASVDDNDSDSNELLEMFYQAPLLSLAVKDGDEGITKLLLEHGADPNTRDQSGKHALTQAVFCRHIPVIRLLLSQKDIVVNTSCDRIGHTPLTTAICRGYVDVAEILLHHGATFDVYYKGRRSPLWEATFSGNREMVEFIYNGGFDPDYRDNHTPLITAAEQGDDELARLFFDRSLITAARDGSAELVHFFINKGAEVDAPDPHGRTPLSIAVTCAYSKAFETLIALGARTDTRDKDGRTPLSWAAYSPCIEAVRALIDLGVEIDSPDNQGRTPLSWAAEGDRLLSVKALLDHGANPAPRDCENETPLSRALGKANDDIVVILLDRGADSDFVATRGAETLLQAASAALPATAKYLLDNGVHPDPTDESGATPLLLALKAGEAEIAEMLIKTWNVNIHTQDSEGRTPLSLAAIGGHGEIVDILIEKGADADSRDNTGRTPLSLVASSLRDYNRDNPALKTLLRAGVEIDSKDDGGRTPLSYAAECGWSIYVYEVLREKGADPFLRDDSGATPNSRAALMLPYGDSD